MKNTSISLGGILLIDKVEKSFDIFSEIFSGVGGKAKDFIGCVKLHLYNNDSFRFHSSDTGNISRGTCFLSRTERDALRKKSLQNTRKDGKILSSYTGQISKSDKETRSS